MVMRSCARHQLMPASSTGPGSSTARCAPLDRHCTARTSGWSARGQEEHELKNTRSVDRDEPPRRSRARDERHGGQPAATSPPRLSHREHRLRDRRTKGSTTSTAIAKIANHESPQQEPDVRGRESGRHTCVLRWRGADVVPPAAAALRHAAASPAGGAGTHPRRRSPDAVAVPSLLTTRARVKARSACSSRSPPARWRLCSAGAPPGR